MIQNRRLPPPSRRLPLNAALLVVANFGSGGALIVAGFIFAALSAVGLR
jgi:hypothetical protein